MDKIEELLEDDDSKKFLSDNLELIRSNLLDAEKKINKVIITIILLISLAELIHSKIITEIQFSGVKIDKLGLVLLVLPCLISYFTYSLFNKIILRNLYNKTFSRIIKQTNPKIADNDIDDILVTHLESNTEDILTKGTEKKLSFLINLFSAPFVLFFQYLPFLYCVFIFIDLFSNKDFYTSKALWLSLIITSLFFLRAILLAIAWINNIGYKKLIKDIFKIK